MQKQQVFKVKGMQRDLSMANANGEFAYEIVNMRLIPAEENQGFSLTNEQGTTHVVSGITGTILGQCATTNSLIVFATASTLDSDGNIEKDYDYIYCIEQDGPNSWVCNPIYEGNLNFHPYSKIEALFNYETEDIQKVYWIDGNADYSNQLRCINIAQNWEDIRQGSEKQFDALQQIDSLPEINIERIDGGSFTAGILQYYITYFNEFSAESPIIYTSPLLYLAHENRGANVNDNVTTAFLLKLSNLDIQNWQYIRLYATHRTSLDATPEGSIVTELKIPENRYIEYYDYGNFRTSIAPSDLYFTGGKYVKAGTMTAKDQVMFLGNLNISFPEYINYKEVSDFFAELRNTGEIDNFFSTETRKQTTNNIQDCENSLYAYKNQLNNTESITHYKYGEKYRFGIQVLDKYGSWSNPIWIKDAFILTPPEQITETILELPCPSLNLSQKLSSGETLKEKLESFNVIAVRPLVVYPEINERKVIAQGVVCPTVYNLNNRKENGPYAQASWFMRPNAPVDLWGTDSKKFGSSNITLLNGVANEPISDFVVPNFSHKSDAVFMDKSLYSNDFAGYYGVSNIDFLNNDLTPFDYVYDDFAVNKASISDDINEWACTFQSTYNNDDKIATLGETIKDLKAADLQKIYEKGSWVEFRHNYALRSKGWSFGITTPTQSWGKPQYDSNSKVNYGMVRCAELDPSSFNDTAPVNRFFIKEQQEVIKVESPSSNNFIFLTKDSPKEVRKKVRNGETYYLDVCYIYRYTEGEVIKTILHNVDRVKITKARAAGSLYQEIQITTTFTYETFKGRFRADKTKPATTKDDPSKYFYQFPLAYLWTVGGVWDDDHAGSKSFENALQRYYPTITIPIKRREEEDLRFGNTSVTALNINNSAYYVDNSIVTLNSPEIEMSTNYITNYENTNFRIVGMIPLTATSSDTTLEVENPSTDLDNLGVGLVKRSYNNVNIGFHGFKGMVSANAYLSSFNANTSTTAYSLTPIYPWQSTGTLGYHKNDITAGNDYTSKDILKTKILSNKRFSASTFYFGVNTLSFDGSFYSNSDHAFIENNIIGWKPGNGCFVDIFTGEDSESMLKLFNLGYTNNSLVYKGNIDSIATMTKGITNTSIPSPIYTFGQSTTEAESIVISKNITARINLPAQGSTSFKYEKSKGASIKYKSSPHFVIGFNCYDSLWGSTQKIQETLPAWKSLNEEGISSFQKTKSDTLTYNHGRLYEDEAISSLYHQNYLKLEEGTFGLPNKYTPSRYDTETINRNYSDYISVGKSNFIANKNLRIDSNVFAWIPKENTASSILNLLVTTSPNIWTISIEDQSLQTPSGGWGQTHVVGGSGSSSGVIRNSIISFSITFGQSAVTEIKEHWITNGNVSELSLTNKSDVKVSYSSEYENKTFNEIQAEEVDIIIKSGSSVNASCDIIINVNDTQITLSNLSLLRDVSEEVYINILPNYGWLWLGEIYREQDPSFGGTEDYHLQQNLWEIAGKSGYTTILTYEDPDTDEEDDQDHEIISEKVLWTIGDTYYQRFDTLKTYAYNETAQNSIIDITSFMVETRVNIDGRYDRNREQESNLYVSPENFNLINNIYSQKDNFFTYRILDDDVQSRTKFPTQITWSLSKTAGETIDSWMNVTMASILNLDGTKGKLTALKTFNNNIIALQDKSISTILFNSRVQIPTSENVPIQIANSGKVDGQQIIINDVGCQDKWNIVTTSQGLYFVDYYNKAIYRFTGKIEDLSLQGGFRGWCNKYINEQSQVVGYYDIKNKEVIFNDPSFESYNSSSVWLGFSELSNSFSSFYTYPSEASLSYIKNIGIWLHNGNGYAHQTGDYNNLIYPDQYYGLIVIARQDSNTVKTFNNVEFRADTYLKDSEIPEERKTFDTIQIEDEYNGPTSATLEFKPYRPSNLKKYLRTWRVNIPRVNNEYKRYVNQWAKIGLWKMNPGLEKTILHDMAVWYSE